MQKSDKDGQVPLNAAVKVESRMQKKDNSQRIKSKKSTSSGKTADMAKSKVKTVTLNMVKPIKEGNASKKKENKSGTDLLNEQKQEYDSEEESKPTRSQRHRGKAQKK